VKPGEIQELQKYGDLLRKHSDLLKFIAERYLPIFEKGSGDILTDLLALAKRRETAQAVAEIALRAYDLQRTGDAMVIAIVDKWFADGCPPVDEVDDALLEARKRKVEIGVSE